MKKTLYILISMLLFFACACQSEKVDTEVTPSPSWQEHFAGNHVTTTPIPTLPPFEASPGPSATPIPIKKADTIEQSYEPKEGQVELILLNDGIFITLDDLVLFELNTLLANRGYSFYVSVSAQPRDDYVTGWCRDYLKSDNPVDLVCTGGNSVDYPSSFTQTIDIVKEDLLLPFSEYPEILEKKQLWDAFPKSVWDWWSILGEVYGVRYANYPFAPATLTVNLELAQKLGIQIPDTLNPSELDEYLKVAADNGYYPLVDGFSWFRYAGYVNVKPGLYVKVEEDGSLRAANPYEDAYARKLMQAENRYRENGWIIQIERNKNGTDNRMELHNKNTLFFSSLETYGALGAYLEGIYRPYSKRELTLSGYDEIEMKVKCFKQSNHVMYKENEAFLMGICRKSEHKEEALQFLALLQTDEEIVKLMRYGVEDVHYVKDNHSYTREDMQSIGYDTLSNSFMYFPEFENISDFVWPSMSREQLDHLFSKDYTMVPLIEYTNEQVSIIEKTMQFLRDNDLSGDNTKLDEKIKMLCQKMKDLGYDRVLDEINAAYFNK